MHERVSKSSSWTPTSIQKKSKSLHAKPSTSIQPKPENISSQQQEIPTYSTAAADLLAANIMRSLEPQEPESSETSTGKPQSELGQAAFPSIAAQIPSTPVVQSQEIGIQRQCSECAKEQSTQEGKDIDEISAAASGIQTKLTIGAPPNPYQQAANQMAEVMSKPILYAPVPQVQRFSPEESQIQLRAASAQSISPMMQMSVEQQAQMSALIQRTFRGEGTQASFEPVQAKLTVGEPGDKYEQEADAVARTVVEKINAPKTESSVQRQSEVGGASQLNITVMRQSESGVGEGASVTQDVEQGIQHAKGGGQTLDESVREPMEQAFGADFSRVKVHADSNADMLNRSISARAFTTGQDIFFKQGEYNPGSRGGQELLAHELTHVVQQTGEVRLQSQNELPMSTPTSVSTFSSTTDTLQRQPADPPNKLVPLSEDPAEKHKVSDAIVEDFRAAATEVQDSTMIDLTKGPGDTVRQMASNTEKPGASNFSWHKTGRAIDIRQDHKWVIEKEPAGDKMQFRIYLEKKNDQKSIYEHTFSRENKPDFQNNPYGNNVYKKTFIDVTQILIDHGFSRIPAQKGWERIYDKKEWWHYEKRDGKTMYQALRDIYTEEDIVKGYSSLVSKNGLAPIASLVRLHKEGFPYETLQNISPKTKNVEREIELSQTRSALTSKKKDYAQAALYLNGLNEADIMRELEKLKKKDVNAIREIHAVASSHPGLGLGSNIYKLTDGI